MVLLCPALSAISFAAELGTPIGRLSYVEGRVDRKDIGSDQYNPMIKGEFVYPGDLVRTKSFSRAEIAFLDKSVVKIGENSQLDLKEYKIHEDGLRENARLFLDRGVIRAIVSKSAGGAQNFLIETPNSSGSVKGSDIGVSYLKASSSFISMSGAIETRHRQFPNQAVTVMKGNTVLIPAAFPPQAARPYLKPEADRLDQDTAPLMERDARGTPSDLSKGVVTGFAGDVRVRSKGTSSWHRAALKEALGEGDEIETGENGSLRLILESGRIVEMSQNTQLSIKKFSVDAKTGLREDLLESNKGEIRARIEKLKGGSKFQIATPTAIASVRGTVLYLNVMPTLTHAFFEAGQGSLASLMNGLEVLIDAGQNAQADGQGNLTDPVLTTDEQHQQLENSFNSQDRTYGYSSADETQITEAPPEGGDGTGNEDPVSGDFQRQQVFDLIPPGLPVTPPSSGSTAELKLAFIENRGTGFGNFSSGERITIENFNGEALNVRGEDSGVWGAVLSGNFSMPSVLSPTLTIAVSGSVRDSQPDPDGLDQEALFFSTVSGQWQAGGDLSGQVKGVWVSESDGDPFLKAGTMDGFVLGASDLNAGTWQGLAAGDFQKTTELLSNAEVGDFLAKNGIRFSEMFHPGMFLGSGSFEGVRGASILFNQPNSNQISFFNTPAFSQNLWTGFFGGTFSDFSAGTNASWTATLNSPESDLGLITANFTGVRWTDTQWAANVEGSSTGGLQFTGSAAGTVTATQVADGKASGTFQGAGAGTWSESQSAV